MPLFFIFFFVVWAACVVKAVLFWTYLWQLKEYRWDRFWAEYGAPHKLIRILLFAGGRSFRAPVLTPKALLILIVTILAFVGACFVPLAAAEWATIMFFVGTYLAVPALVACVVFLMRIPTMLAKERIYAAARDALGRLPQMTVIGITGSYGKSSTKEFLAHILGSKFRVMKTTDNVNTEIGIAQFVVHALRPDTEIFVIEMGAYRIGEIKRICDMVHPKIGILTGINEQHLGLFGSLENIKKAKFELIESLPLDGIAFFNGENRFCVELARQWKGRQVIYRRNATPFMRRIPPHYEVNLNAAIEVAKQLGMSEKEIEVALSTMEMHDRLMQMKAGKNDVLVIDDTYSANPDGVLAALTYLKEMKRAAKIIVMPCLIELGDAAHDVHRRIGKEIDEVCDLAIVTTPDYFEDIRAEAGEKAIMERDLRRIQKVLGTYMNRDAAILLEGRLPDALVRWMYL